MSEVQHRLRGLPSVDRLLNHRRIQALLERYNRAHVVRHCHELLDETRDAIRLEQTVGAGVLDEESIVIRLEHRLELDDEGKLRRVVNATGTVLHTNLGRAILPRPGNRRHLHGGRHPMNLEYDLAGGERGKREAILEDLLRQLTGAEATTVVNNNAAAVLLCLNTLAMGREVIVSRGELIEIGGAFRLPEIMAKSGAILREVGTTNRTHRADYEQAIGDKTGLLLKVHTSNYRIMGFSSEVGLAELAAIGQAHGVPVMEDLGSGALVDLSRFGLPKEPVVSERIRIGADVVTFSGDKLMGGPQAGIVAGRKKHLQEIFRNPLHRALRCGKLTIAALEATLRLYQQSPAIAEAIPTLKALTRSLDDIDAMGRRVLSVLRATLGPGFRVSLEDSTSLIGSGALPTAEIPTRVIAIEHDGWSPDRMAERFRQARPPIIGRIKDGRFLLDLRTIFTADDLVPRWTSET